MLKYTTYKSIHKTNSTTDEAASSAARPSTHTANDAAKPAAAHVQATSKQAISKEPAVTEWVYVKGDTEHQKPLKKHAGRSFRRKTLDLIQMTARKAVDKKSKRSSKKRKSGWNSTSRLMVSILFAGVLLYGGFQHFVIADEASAMRQHVIVNEGDSLWAIASQYKAPGADIRDYIAEIRDENNLNTSDIQSGDVLVIPHN
ncbi:LysM peptidoglycan-binding domain-containing protein [Paenibacillus wenxiniae]|uniref:LysM peptidoglycan-binding domain-containing protein n=1 Tax=Paenibacillus wenxiniae TaxID=1636843 RepID=A0ABW4RDE1_9BACL